MSRFFRGGDDSSSDSSSDEEELYSEEEEEEKSQDEDEDKSEEEADEEEAEESSDDEGAQKKGASRFMVDVSSESEESDVETTTKVKSAKDRRYEELAVTVNSISNGQKNGDWGLISSGSYHAHSKGIKHISMAIANLIFRV